MSHIFAFCDALLAIPRFTQAEIPDIGPKEHPSHLADGLDREVLPAPGGVSKSPPEETGLRYDDQRSVLRDSGIAAPPMTFIPKKLNPAKECRPAPGDAAKSPPEEAGL